MLNMKAKLIRASSSWLMALCAVLVLALFAMSFPVLHNDVIAEEKKEKRDFSQVRTRRVATLRKTVYDKLARVQKVLEEEKNPGGAERLLANMLRSHERGKESLNSYEVANIWNTYGYLYYAQEKYAKAIDAYERAISDPAAIPAAMFNNLRFVIAQMFFVTEQYDEAIRRLNEWIGGVKKPGPNVWFLLAQAHFQNEERDKALEYGIKAYELAKRRNLKMRQGWYLLLRALYYEQGDHAEVVTILKELIRGWPKREYWVQLSGLYGQQEQMDNQIIGLETAYLQEILIKEKEYTSLAYLLMGRGIPYKAAQVMEFGLENEYVEPTSKNLELLGSAWQAAREIDRALPVLENAAEDAENGNIYARLASVYLDLHRFDDAVRAAKAAKEKGEIKREDTLNVVLGMSLFNMQRYDEANTAFEYASEDERSESLANQWQVHIIREKRRLRQLQKEVEEPDLFDLLRGS
jgi:tetratricopeptide (TPR) repeat protein